jgi:hypothetical protein
VISHITRKWQGARPPVLHILFMLMLCGNATAQISENNEVLQQPVLYSKYIVKDYLKNKEGKKTWFWFVDVVYRRQSGLEDRSNIVAHPLRFSVRPYMGYQIGRFFQVMLCPVGYFNSFDRIGQPSDYVEFRHEHELRTTLELLHDSYIKKKGKEWVNVTYRHRFESRFRDVTELNGDMRWNFRYRFRTRFRTPLNGKHFFDNNVLYICNYHEFHLENGPHHGPNKLSQNRNFVGVGYRFWDWVRVDVGYLHQYNWRGNGKTVDLTQAPMFYIFIDYLSKVKIPKGGKVEPKPRPEGLIAP